MLCGRGLRLGLVNLIISAFPEMANLALSIWCSDPYPFEVSKLICSFKLNTSQSDCFDEFQSISVVLSNYVLSTRSITT